MSENAKCPTCSGRLGGRWGNRCYVCKGRPKTGGTKQCATCGKAFHAPQWKQDDIKRNQGTYCSRDCKHEAQRLVVSKPCTKCGITKSLNEFPPDKRNVSGRQSRCRECCKQISVKWREENPEHYEELKKTPRTEHQRILRFQLELKKRYGLTLADYEAMAEAQGNVCAICRQVHIGRGSKLYVDHCHETEKVRGLLCSNCNTAIGLFKDDSARIQAAIDYLNK